jgi:hypothetical protein
VSSRKEKRVIAVRPAEADEDSDANGAVFQRRSVEACVHEISGAAEAERDARRAEYAHKCGSGFSRARSMPCLVAIGP